MTALARLAGVGLVRAPVRTCVRTVTLAAAVGLLAAMLLFVGHSLRTMTASATRSVPLDWQGPVGSYQTAVRVARRVARQPGVLEAAAAATAPFAGVSHVAPSLGTIRAGAGAILAVPTGYASHSGTIRFLRGGLACAWSASSTRAPASTASTRAATASCSTRPTAAKARSA